MASPPHRENLLDPSFKEVGFGYANNPNYTAAGGGPMTIIVAFYGEPQVLAAATSSPPPAPIVTNTAPAPVPAPQPQPAPEPAPTPEPTKEAAKPAASNIPKQNIAPPVKQTRAQLALTSATISPAVTTFSIFAALTLGGFWLSRHLVAAHRFLLKGERYVIRHPLTDIGILVIACLIFILSQTAGIIQ